MSIDDASGKADDIADRMQTLGVREEDLLEKFVRASGPGGQHVNKTATAVYLKHLPSGVEVKVQSERSQAQNRLSARRLLVEKLEQRAEKARIEDQKRRAKTLRQRRQRPRAVKAKILESKRRRGEIKRQRSKISNDSGD